MARCFTELFVEGHIGEPTGSVLFDRSAFTALFARCHELQEYSARLSAEAIRMRIHLNSIRRRSDALITSFQSRFTDEPAPYPRRQWPLCPKCASRDTLKVEIPHGDMFLCSTCQHRWATA